jgi:hypothetical protein
VETLIIFIKKIILITRVIINKINFGQFKEDKPNNNLILHHN